MKSWVLPIIASACALACTDDVDCSLNGICQSGTCACDAPWGGPNCELLQFKPVSYPQGYGTATTVATWGGNAIYNETDGLYHMFVSRMTNECQLNRWTKNSRIDHAVSPNITGPYTFMDIAINTWSHNAAPVQLKDGTFAIFHIGDGTGAPDGGANCTNASEPDAAAASTTGLRAGTLAGRKDGWRGEQGASKSAPSDHASSRSSSGSTIHVSNSLYGPWEPLQPNPLPGCNNPAPWVHPDNGTVYIVCRPKIYRTDNLTEGWTYVADVPTHGGAGPNQEDPFLYTDKRGNWHAIFHTYDLTHPDQCRNSTVSSHAFSPDGYNWTMSPVQPYTTQVPIGMGEYITVSTRERPKLWFNKEGVPTHLFNGVCSAAACPGIPCVNCKTAGGFWDYTLVAPLSTADD